MLTSEHAFIINGELLQGLERVLKHESVATLEWLLLQTMDSFGTGTEVWNIQLKDVHKINAFTVFQAFFMGYYYEIFLGMVDTSSLQLNLVDGSWGFRSARFLCNMRTFYNSSDNRRGPKVLVLWREGVISILTNLLFSTNKIITRIKHATYNKDNWCIGVTGKRALLVESLVSPCKSIKHIGSFILLDVDASGIPTDPQGLVRSGVSDKYMEYTLDTAQLGLHSSTRFERDEMDDVSFHIEADWEGDPDTILICARYRGRRIATLNPSVADLVYCSSVVRAVDDPVEQTSSNLIEWSINDCLNRNQLPLRVNNDIYIMRLSSRPRMQYAVLAWYHEWHVVRLSSTNDSQTAIEQAKAEAKIRSGVSRKGKADDGQAWEAQQSSNRTLIVNCASSILHDDWLSEKFEDIIDETESKRTRGWSQTALGDVRIVPHTPLDL